MSTGRIRFTITTGKRPRDPADDAPAAAGAPPQKRARFIPMHNLPLDLTVPTAPATPVQVYPPEPQPPIIPPRGIGLPHPLPLRNPLARRGLIFAPPPEEQTDVETLEMPRESQDESPSRFLN